MGQLWAVKNYALNFYTTKEELLYTMDAVTFQPNAYVCATPMER